MKLTTLLLITVCLHVSASSYAQRVTISGKDLSLEKVFSMIKKQTGYVFFYDYSVFRDARKVSLDLHSAEVDEAIKTCLNGQDLDYNIVNKTVYVTRREERAAPVAAGDPPAKIDVRGKVVNDKGEPVPGATVKIKGSKLASASTNDQGEFILRDVEATASIVISSVGYELWEIRLKGKGDLTVLLHTKISSLDETQVIAYGTTTQRFNVGSVSTVKAEDIAKQPVTNPLQALEGRVPGLVVNQSSGVPGAALQIQIRGQNSLSPTAGNVLFDNPLFIIDGVPFSPQNSTISQYSSTSYSVTTLNGNRGNSPFNSINPADIESIDVLRDADATAIYGSRGANGVILITTKRGKAGQTRFTGNVYTGGSKVTRSMPLMNTKQYLQMRHEALNNDGLVASTDPSDAGYAPDLLVFDTTKYTDWKKYFIGGTARTTEANASISGGNSNTQFLVGSGYHHESYVFPGDFGDNRISVNAHVHHNSTDKKLSMDLSTNYSYDQNNSSSGTSILKAFTLLPNFPDLLNPDGSLRWSYNGISLNDATPFGGNPLAYLKQPYSIKNYNLISSFQIGYQIFRNLTIRSSFGFNTLNVNEYQAFPKSSQDPASYPVSSANFGTSNYRTWVVEPQVEYKKIIGEGTLDVLAGETFQKNTTASTNIAASNYSNDLLIGSITSAGITSARDASSLYKYNGAFGRLKYTFKNQYIINLSGRRDGSSRFGPGDQFGNFGSVGAGWLFSEAGFVKNAIPALSYGKIRVSYGTTGSDNIANYQYFAAYAPLANVNYQGSVGYNPQNLYNPDLHWALTKKLEVGLEWGIWGDRLIGNLAWYQNRSGNQLVAYTLPSQSGFTRVTRNAPYTVQNTGIELQLTSTNIKGKDFQWNTTLNLSIPRNKLLSFPNIAGSPYANTYVVGKSVTVLNKFKYLGINDTTGVYTFQDVNHDGAINLPKDYQVSGNLDPVYYGGIGNTFGYRGFQIYFFVQFIKQLGANYLQQIYATGYPVGYQINEPAALLSNWKNEGDHATVEKFATQYGDAYSAGNNLVTSNGAYSDASFVRFKTLSLSYNVPVEHLKKAKMQAFSIYINAQNLFTITKFKGNDPENQNFYSLPPLRTLTAGLQFTF